MTNSSRPSHARAISLTLLLAGLAACDSTRSRGSGLDADSGDGHLGAPIELRTNVALERIARLEDARDPGGGELLELLEQGARQVRARAAEALGRMPLSDFGAEVTEPLCDSLDDPAPEVRTAAAFALGVRADPASGSVLLAYASDPDPLVRARVIDALSKLPPTPESIAAVLAACQDPEREVVIAAVVGAHRLPVEGPESEDVDTALLGVLRPFRAPMYGSDEPHPGVVWYTLSSLARRGSAKGRGAFLEFLHSRSSEARLFAAQGLAGLPADPESTAALLRASGDADWRVAVEALRGLQQHGEAKSAVPVLDVAQHPSHHVRAAALAASSRLAAGGNELEIEDEVRSALEAGLRDRSATVRAAALAGLARVLPDEEAGELLAEYASDESFVLRAAVASAAAESLPADEAVGRLLPLVEDRDPSVRRAAVEGLGKHGTDRSLATLRALLQAPDLALRTAAVEALAAHATESDADALALAAATGRGEGASELSVAVIRALGRVGGERARAHLLTGALNLDPHVRRVAHEVYAVTFPEQPMPRVIAPERPRDEVPLAGRHYELYRRNPVLVLETTRGEMRFELFPAEAPVHVHNLVQLVERGHYDGLRFHRVVSDFVIQGGDHRGDGNGAKPWRGLALRHEFGPRRYVRGSLGMPRGEDVESGGSQIFATHRPAPHLDGRYTNFGELRAGEEVLDAIEVGDAIISASIER